MTTKKTKLPRFVLPLSTFLLGILLCHLLCRWHVRPFIYLFENESSTSLAGCTTMPVYSEANGMKMNSTEASIKIRNYEKFMQPLMDEHHPGEIFYKGGRLSKCLLLELLKTMGNRTDVGYGFGCDTAAGTKVYIIFRGSTTPEWNPGLSGPGPTSDDFLRNGKDGLCPDVCW